MKKLLIIVMITIPTLVFPQSEVANRFRQKVKNRISQRTSEGMDKAIDKAGESLKEPPGQVNSKVDTMKKKSPEVSDKVGEEQIVSTNFQSYSRYDFIPGENILYAEDFFQDPIGEMPQQWITNNRGEIINEKSSSSKWLRLFPGSRFTSPSIKKLPQNFTIEMDIILQFNGEGGYSYPEFQIKLLDLIADKSSASSYVVNEDAQNEVSLVLLPASDGKALHVHMKSFTKGSESFSNSPKEVKNFPDYTGKPIHLSIWVQKERVRYWINGDKVYDIPQAIPEESKFNHIGFNVESTIYEEEEFGIYVSNFKIAEGMPDMRNKLLNEGKLITHGILFDSGSDIIKGESAGILKEIAATLNENSKLKIKVVGHTDSDGDAVKNLELSRLRSISVKKALVQTYGIDPVRIETDGLGESTPIADNSNKEGRAINRRVEFIKL